ncbi:MAG: S49 family peptidase [Betaproteobacteria bacterium]|nr:S49 family peptidase [Pseudomonadota bacterium]NBO11549.1 S49 family peptidase [Betaproteobacteria bacterium]NBO43342.1 S49 family peptidase [Betaproteobacteria bacterium]NBP09754.1 S49 family peptidase [Betaproteobacteria bacterium]NBP61147.1 S49 family peptidase [Betaproteobacteria bacterium]
MLEQEKQSDATEPPRGVAAEAKPVDGSDKASAWTTAHEIQQVALLRLLEAHQYERVRKRRWSILFRSLFFLLLLLFWYEWRSVSGHEVAKPERHTALIDIQGEIDHESDANADQITSALRAAFDDKATAGVILRLNSPGGSPVQASIIHQEILRLRAKHPTIPIHTVIEDICASGGYYIAAASDRIYVDPNSLVGSIGVRLDGFGFTEAIKRLGIERRLFTAGSDKAMLDPFSGLSESQRAHVQSTLDALHQNFIEAVKLGRGDRLQDDSKLFSGRVWSGDQAIKLGLADARGSVDQVARDVIKADDVVDFSPRPSLAERFARRVGVETSRVLSAVGFQMLGGNSRLR